MGRYDWLDEPRDWRPRGVAEVGIRTDYGIHAQVKEGVQVEDLRAVATDIWGDAAEANKLIHAIVPKTSLNRRGKLTQAQGEQTERLGRLFGMARMAFQDQEDARDFMRRPHPELGGRRPVDAALTEMGGRAVERVLDSLLYGLPV